MRQMMDITVRVPMPEREPAAPPLVPQDASAAIITVDGDYLMQLRDDKPWIFYPDHWGLFGGALESGEGAIDAIRRELREELGQDVPLGGMAEFCTLDISMGESGKTKRVVYTLALPPEDLTLLSLGEGQAMRRLTPAEVVDPKRKMCPYDAFAIWLHIQQRREEAVS